MSLSELMKDEGDDVYYEASFRTVIEAHLDYLIDHSATDTHTVETKHSARFANDLYGYLTYKTFEPEFHWIIMRVNGMHDPNEFEDMLSLLVPSDGTIETLVQQYQLHST